MPQQVMGFVNKKRTNLKVFFINDGTISQKVVMAAASIFLDY